MYGNYMLGNVLIIVGFIIMFFAQMKVQSAYNKYSRLVSKSGLTGYETARRILDQNGLYDVEIRQIRGQLSDHYDPSKKVVNLSQAVYSGNSIASIAVAAHEVGHALQHSVGYKALLFRNSILPLVNVGQTLGMIAIFIGIFTSMFNMALLGVFLISGMLIFQLVTLPVEFNASNRALSILSNGMIASDEVDGAKAMLSAAAFTYVASAISTLLQILRLFLIFGSNDDR